MKITDALRTNGTRITYGNRWLVFDHVDLAYVVYEHIPYQKGTTVIVSSRDENLISKELLKG